MKKKILFVINTLGRAGAENALIALLNSLDQTKVQIYLYVCLDQGELIDEIPEYVTVINKRCCNTSVLSGDGKRKLVKHLFCKIFKHGAVINNIPYIVSNAFESVKSGRGLNMEKLLWSTVADSCERFDIHFDLAVSYIEGASAYYVDRYVNADKKAAFIHIDYTSAGYTRKLDRDCFARFDRIFTVSGEVKDSFLKVYPECSDRVKVFHNIINIEGIKRKALEEKVLEPGITASEGIKLLTVCRLTPQKSLEVSVGAMKILVDRGIKASWYCLGDGPERGKLEKEVEQMGLEGKFVFLGAKTNPYPYYKKSDIYVHATRFEGKSIAIQEAQILGCPVIASDCSGNREQVVDGVDGYLCEFSQEGIASAIMKMLDNKQHWDEYTSRAREKVHNDDKELNYLYELL